MSKSAEKFGGFPHFMWLFSRVLALWRTFVRRREPNHAFCIKMTQPLLFLSRRCFLLDKTRGILYNNNIIKILKWGVMRSVMLMLLGGNYGN